MSKAWFGIGFGTALILCGIITFTEAWGAYSVHEFNSAHGLFTAAVIKTIAGAIIAIAAVMRHKKQSTKVAR